MYSIGFLSLVSFLLAMLVTPLVRDAFQRAGVVDAPDGGRKLHAGATPRMGGVALALVYGATFVLWLATPLRGGELLESQLDLVWRVLPAAAIVFVMGLVDDLRGLPAWVKLTAHAAAGLAVYAAGVRLTGVGGVDLGMPWVSLPLTVFWLALCTNAFNLIDGVDGLAAGVGLFATLTALAAGWMQGNVGLVMATAALAGALLGFLRYNFSPASIFLGDSGSYLVGFLLGCYGLIWSQKAATFLGMTAPLMALAVPLADVGLSVVRRWLRGAPVFAADRGHIHHKLLERGWTARRTVLVLYGVSGVSAVLALVGSAASGRTAALAALVFVAVAGVAVQQLGYVELSAAGARLRRRGGREKGAAAAADGVR